MRHTWPLIPWQVSDVDIALIHDGDFIGWSLISSETNPEEIFLVNYDDLASILTKTQTHCSKYKPKILDIIPRVTATTTIKPYQLVLIKQCKIYIKIIIIIISSS